MQKMTPRACYWITFAGICAVVFAAAVTFPNRPTEIMLLGLFLGTINPLPEEY